MIPLSVIIICKNEGSNIERTLASICQLTDDIILVDSGSTDNTLLIAKQYKVRIIQTGWGGFGANKNLGISHSKYNWILSLDADEVVDPELFISLKNKTFFNENIVYRLRFTVFIGNIPLRHGQPGRVKKVRIFNKKKVYWNNHKLHEGLVHDGSMKIEDLPGHILHYSYRDIDHCIYKTNKYTSLVAEEMSFQKKSSSFVKIYLNPIYTFILNYIFRLGILDGFWGYTYARMNSYYSFLKYAKLKQLNDNKILLSQPVTQEQLSIGSLEQSNQAILN